MERWRGTRGVTSLETRWLSLPQRVSESDAPLHACVEVLVGVTGMDAAALRILYSRLSREASSPLIQLRGRSCILNDMFAADA